MNKGVRIDIREATIADAGAIATVHVASWRTTYPGIVPDEHLASLDVEDRKRRWRLIFDAAGEDFTYVAETQGGEIVGFAGGGPESTGDPVYRGELFFVYLLQTHQRKGIGRQLTAVIARRLIDADFHSMLLWVLEGNTPSRRFYEALGGVCAREQPITIGGASLIEVAYGWRDIADLGAMWPPREALKSN